MSQYRGAIENNHRQFDTNDDEEFEIVVALCPSLRNETRFRIVQRDAEQPETPRSLPTFFPKPFSTYKDTWKSVSHDGQCHDLHSGGNSIIEERHQIASPRSLLADKNRRITPHGHVREIMELGRKQARANLINPWMSTSHPENYWMPRSETFQISAGLTLGHPHMQNMSWLHDGKKRIRVMASCRGVSFSRWEVRVRVRYLPQRLSTYEILRVVADEGKTPEDMIHSLNGLCQEKESRLYQASTKPGSHFDTVWCDMWVGLKEVNKSEQLWVITVTYCLLLVRGVWLLCGLILGL